MKIEIDPSQMAAVQIMLSGVKNGPARVVSRSINKTIKSVGAQAAKVVSAIYNITQANVKKNFNSLKATVARPSGQFYSKGKPKSLTSFSGTKQNTKGVSVKVLKASTRKTIKHAFIARAKGSDQVFWREQKFDPRRPVKSNFPYGMLPRKYRYPILIRKGPRIEDALGKSEVNKRIVIFSGDRIKTVIDQELNFELSKL